MGRAAPRACFGRVGWRERSLFFHGAFREPVVTNWDVVRGLGSAHGAVPVFLVQRDNWAIEEVIRIPDKEVTGWIMNRMPGWSALSWCSLIPPGARCCVAWPSPVLTLKALLRKDDVGLVGGAGGLCTPPGRQRCRSWSLGTWAGLLRWRQAARNVRERCELGLGARRVLC